MSTKIIHKNKILKNKIINLYKKTATKMPDDIVSALNNNLKKETQKTAKEILNQIIKNTDQAQKESKPICQDTGTPIFYVKYPTKNYSQKQLRTIINKATNIASKQIPLRDNTVDSLTGESLGNVPVIHFKEGDKLEIDLMLKGGGSENVSVIYNLPNQEINAHRDLDGVRKCILDAIFKAQGKGCPPYIVGVAIGGSIEWVSRKSKRMLLQKLTSKNPNKKLYNFEKKVLKEINQLGIGPLGLGGKTTALGVKIASGFRHPASFVVGISISCWALRRQSI